MSKIVMRGLTLLFVILVLGIGVAQARTYVVVAGVSNYNDPANNLPQAAKDAKSIAALFKNKYPDTSLFTSKYANRNNILGTLSKIAKQASASDRIIFYYSGHGGMGYMHLTKGVRFQYSELLNVVASSRSRYILLIIDACKAGSIAKDLAQLKSRGKYQKNIIIITSSRANESSLESNAYGAGVLTQGLLKGLRGKSDADGNRSITVEELFRYAYNDVTAHTRGTQHPQLIGAERLKSMEVMRW